LGSPTDTVTYHSKLNAKINRNFEVFTPTDFLAAITQHIPDKGAQMVRYYGWYSNKMRGVRQRGLAAELAFRRPGVSPPPPVKLPSKRWRDLILWHGDPLRCPVCQNSMRPSPSLMTRGWWSRYFATWALGTARPPERRRRASRVHTPTNRATISP
jgi:hypothetical protein